MAGWALDLGTTNTGIARWDGAAARPRLLHLPAVSRLAEEGDPLHAPRLIPSATHVIAEPDVWTRLSRLPLLRSSLTLGRHAHIGRAALELNQGRALSGFAPRFKASLARAPIQPLARGPAGAYSAREVAWMFLRELLGEVQRETGERVRELVVTVPVESYEIYRTEVAAILSRLGVTRVRFIDEPVAAALGYGLGLSRPQQSLVVDFGGGTLDLALVRFTASNTEVGTCEVIAKTGRFIGGDLVDRWLLEALCERLGYPLPEHTDRIHDESWFELMLGEARRVKEALFFDERVHFDLLPPDDLRAFEARLRGELTETDVARELLVQVLTENGLYETLERCLSELDEAAHARGVALDEVEDVLMVGGSTLLPHVFGVFEDRFGRDRVRAWQPFEAVAYGATAMAAGRIASSDHIVHDYALRTRDKASGEPHYEVIVPAGTRFPTAGDVWKRQLVPTCARGEPETYFKLVVCEIGRADPQERSFAWDERGRLHTLGGEAGAESLVVALNEKNPTLGTLDPPHAPSDTRPRLEIGFGINAERWLVANVYDLARGRHLMQDEAVVRLL